MAKLPYYAPPGIEVKVTDESTVTASPISPSLTTHQHDPNYIATHNGSVIGNLAVTGTWQTANYAQPDKSKMNIDGSHIKFYNYEGALMIDFDINTGEITMNNNASIELAAELFWRAVGQYAISKSSKQQHERLGRDLHAALVEADSLRDELSRTKQLLNKSLKALAEKYKGDEEDVHGVRGESDGDIG